MIIGIDPSLTSTGVVVLADNGSCLAAAQIPSGPGEPLHQRLRSIARRLVGVVSAHEDDLWQVFIEEPGGQLKGAAQDCRTLFWFVVEELCDEHFAQVTICGLAPATLTKFITGRGNATAQDKCAAVMARWMHLLPEEFHVSPESKGGVARCKDLFDGLALAQAGLTHLTGQGTVAQKLAIKGKVKVIVGGPQEAIA